MDILDRIVKLREGKGWSEYRLSVETGIPQSTISSWYRKNAQPSINSLCAICNACGITLSNLFSEDDDTCQQLTNMQLRLINAFAYLNVNEQQKLIEFLESFKKR